MKTVSNHEPLEPKLLEGKVALITGAGSGIGRSSAILLAKHGAKVCLVDIDEARLQQVQSEIHSNHQETLSIKADITLEDDIKRAVNQVIEKWGQLDIVFANAGIVGKLSPIEDMNADDWDLIHNVNLKGAFLTIKSAIPHMKVKGGSMIVTSSINGSRLFSNRGYSAYSASKAGLLAFARMAAIELSQYKIRVNTICPGYIETNISQSSTSTPELSKIKTLVNYPEGRIPLGGPGKPEQVADTVLFLASSHSEHITGTEIYVDGAEGFI